MCPLLSYSSHLDTETPFCLRRGCERRGDISVGWSERALICGVSRGTSYVCVGGCVVEVYLGVEKEKLLL